MTNWLMEICWIRGSRRIRDLRTRSCATAAESYGVYRFAQRQQRARRAARKRRRGWA